MRSTNNKRKKSHKEGNEKRISILSHPEKAVTTGSQVPPTALSTTSKLREIYTNHLEEDQHMPLRMLAALERWLTQSL